MIAERAERDVYVFDVRLILMILISNTVHYRSGSIICIRSVFQFVQVRNHGESPHSVEFTYPIIANDLIHFMRKHSIEKAAMLGHSLGNLIWAKL